MVSHARGAENHERHKRWALTEIQQNSETNVSPHFILRLIIHHLDSGLHGNVFASIHDGENEIRKAWILERKIDRHRRKIGNFRKFTL
jgi:hypothetical protein